MKPPTSVRAGLLIVAGCALVFTLYGLLEVFGSFAVQGLNAGLEGSPIGIGVWVASMAMIIGVSALELLVCAIQAYVFALLTSVYLNDAENLH